MKTKTRPILGLIASFVIFFFVFKGKTISSIVSGLFIPTVCFAYVYRTSELRKTLSEELFKKKQKRIHLSLFLLTWLFTSASLIIERFESLDNVKWFTAIAFGFGGAFIIYIGLRAFDFFSKRHYRKYAK